MKSLMTSFARIVENVLGKKQYGLNLFGLQIFLITITNQKCYNFFLFYVPLLRVEVHKERFAINLLPFVWLYKLITGWKFELQQNGLRITFLGKTIYENVIIEPYKFPAANFKD